MATITIIRAHEKSHNKSIKPLARLKHSLFRLARPDLQGMEQAFNYETRRGRWASVPRQVKPPREGVA